MILQFESRNLNVTMAKSTEELLIPDELVLKKIYLVREQKVMLDKDLAELYGVETKRLKEAIRRNIQRFPEDFMFELTQAEFESLRTQFATLEKGRRKYSKFNPFVCWLQKNLLVALFIFG